jgi:hypothetical protein
MSGSPRRPPTSAFVVVALVLLSLGATWWHTTRPAPGPVAGAARSAPVDSAQAPAGSIVVLRLDNGRILKYESDGSAPATSWHRRCPGGLRTTYLRSVGQDNLARC